VLLANQFLKQIAFKSLGHFLSIIITNSCEHPMRITYRPTCRSLIEDSAVNSQCAENLAAK